MVSKVSVMKSVPKEILMVFVMYNGRNANNKKNNNSVCYSNNSIRKSSELVNFNPIYRYD